MHLDIRESDVSEADKGFAVAVLQGVEKAARTVSIWFFHLLRADVDAPPYWLMDFEVLVQNVCDFAT